MMIDRWLADELLWMPHDCWFQLCFFVLYPGEWKDNKAEGKGKYIYVNGNRYEGKATAGQPKWMTTVARQAVHSCHDGIYRIAFHVPQQQCIGMSLLYFFFPFPSFLLRVFLFFFRV